MSEQRLLDPSWTFLNHGSFGSTPRALLDLQATWREQMEAQPVLFLHRRLPALLDEQRAAIAPFLGADPAGLAFVRNATTGVAVVLNSLELQPGDEILLTDHGYGAVARAVEHLCRRSGAHVVTVPVPFPIEGPAPVVQAIAAGLSPRTRLCIVDWITSPTALVFPVAEITALCRERGVPVLVDGAHTPGQVPVDLAALGADYYTGNLHKWLCAPKGTAVFWAAPRWRRAIHHPVVSHGLGLGLHAELDWTGTDDPTGWLCAAAAVALHREAGEASLRAAHHRLLCEARALLCERLDLSAPAPQSLLAAMVTLPLPGRTEADFVEVQAALHTQRVEVPVIPWGGRLWFRISAYATYNRIEQYERLALVLAAILKR